MICEKCLNAIKEKEVETQLGKSQIDDEIKWNSPSREMTDKPVENIQMTEAWAMTLYTLAQMPVEEYLRRLKSQGVIKKTELETLVDEAEKINMDYNSPKGTVFTHRDILEKYFNVIQALKKDHPDF